MRPVALLIGLAAWLIFSLYREMTSFWISLSAWALLILFSWRPRRPLWLGMAFVLAVGLASSSISMYVHA